MFDFLVDLPNLPKLSQMYAVDGVLSQAGTLSELSPLQLACKLGDHKMFGHIIRRHSSVVWVWGPVTQHHSM